MTKCNCTRHDLINFDVIEVSRIVHSADFCGGKHAYELHCKDGRITELEAENAKLQDAIVEYIAARDTDPHAGELFQSEHDRYLNAMTKLEELGRTEK